MKKSALIGLLLILTFVLGIFASRIVLKPEIITNTETEIDTIYIKTEPIIKWKKAIVERIVFDTLIIVDKDTVILKDTIQIASDTVEFKEGWLGVKYYYIPINKFRYDWRPVSIPIIYKKETTYIRVKSKWYRSPYLWGVTGILIGVTISK